MKIYLIVFSPLHQLYDTPDTIYFSKRTDAYIELDKHTKSNYYAAKVVEKWMK